MAVVVFDSDVLIGFMNGSDAHHRDAVAWMREALTPGTDRRLCVVNLSEILIGPLRQGTSERVVQMLSHLGIETVEVDDTLAHAAARVRADTNLKLPDAFAVATALAAVRRDAVRLATFDADVVQAHARLTMA